MSSTLFVRLRKMEALLEDIDYQEEGLMKMNDIAEEVMGFEGAKEKLEGDVKDLVQWLDEMEDREIARKIAVFRCFVGEYLANAQHRHQCIIRKSIELLPQKEERIVSATSFQELRAIITESPKRTNDEPAR